MNALTRKYGPLAGWVWLLIITGIAYLYLSYRKKQSTAAAAAAQSQTSTSSNLGTVPVSNLTTAAQPMPIQLGDTFVSVPQNISTNTTTNVPITNTPPPATTVQPAPPPAAPPPPTTPGYGLVNTVQGLMVWLGVDKPGQNIYNVGGGAPVYFGNASNLSIGPPSSPGQDIYTPAGYQGQVATTTAPLQTAY